MLLLRRTAAASFPLALAAAISACFSGSTSSSAGTGGHPSSSATTSGTGGASTASGSAATGGATTTSTTVGTGGAGAGPADAGKDDADILDAADESLGKGGLKLGVPCGASAASLDAGTCGLDLSCCFPCTEQMCDSVCTISCNPHQSGCMGGCIPQL